MLYIKIIPNQILHKNDILLNEFFKRYTHEKIRQ